METVVVFDLDGTLSDMSHRIEYVKARDWDKFFDGIEHDKPIKPVLDIAHMYQERGIPIVISTGRPFSYLAATYGWLSKHGIYPRDIIMREEDDLSPDEEVKARHMKDILRAYNVLCAFDDRPQIVKTYRDMGITALQCAEGY